MCSHLFTILGFVEPTKVSLESLQKSLNYFIALIQTPRCAHAFLNVNKGPKQLGPLRTRLSVSYLSVPVLVSLSVSLSFSFSVSMSCFVSLSPSVSVSFVSDLFSQTWLVKITTTKKSHSPTTKTQQLLFRIIHLIMHTLPLLFHEANCSPIQQF